MRQLYTDKVGRERSERGIGKLIELMKAREGDDSSAIDAQRAASLLRCHIELVRLLAACTKGHNNNTERNCAIMLPVDHVVEVDFLPTLSLVTAPLL